jgi:hypothetical protein
VWILESPKTQRDGQPEDSLSVQTRGTDQTRMRYSLLKETTMNATRII